MASRRIFTALKSTLRPMSSRTDAVIPEVLNSDRLNAIRSKIADCVSDEKNRLFAVVYVNNRQFKVSQDDLIHLHHNLPLDVGDKIKLEKILMVGGAEFTLMGRPLLDSQAVNVSATVVEKTTTAPELDYHMVNHKGIKIMKWLSKELTVLRINEIVVKSKVMGVESAQN
uniref:Large ribosomal subunit protein bL21m n=1 Tax=Steinernema glaseri TaxID=37863 RepID=A0A1I7ZVS9_9BILA